MTSKQNAKFLLNTTYDCHKEDKLHFLKSVILFLA